ncbi:hypothetical protein ACH5RR_020544 [Cinchona calisaya]|uniref:Uncharacterized protein n=1 Tax=Cinchona calisaya TaxID=153742 RepID=A0ABD2ZER5_9GENT
MGDLVKISKAKRELEELYSGIPDDSVNLTFSDLAELRQMSTPPSIDKKNSGPLDPITETSSPRTEEVEPLTNSLDFSRGLKASAHQIQYQSQHLPHLHHLTPHCRETYNSPILNNHYVQGEITTPNHHQQHHHHHVSSPFNHSCQHGMHSDMVYDDMSQMSGMSNMAYPDHRGGRRRPGIPHSNICTICTTYIYIFLHRCLVCGRAYCRQCVGIGMGEMTEGRKCIECLGRRFSQRYIQRAGQIGCCMGYSSIVKQQELKWAEKGTRGSGDNNRYNRSGMVMVSRSTNPAPPRTPNHRAANNPHSFVSNAQSSFVMGSPYSPYYAPKNHPLPF